MKKFFVVGMFAFLFFFASCDSKKSAETHEDVQTEVAEDAVSSDGTGATDAVSTDATDDVVVPVDVDAGASDGTDLPDDASATSLPDDATGA